MLRRLFCFHHWADPHAGVLTFRLARQYWMCVKCGKEIHRPMNWIPLNYLGERGEPGSKG